MTDAEFDELHGGRELLPIEQAIYEAEGAERFARFHGHGKAFPQQVENFAPLVPMALPICEQHGQMEHQKPGTPEQEWCGVWYRCAKCTNTVLFPSKQLEAA